MGAVRASYSGAVLTGFVTGVLGLTLAAPLALAAGRGRGLPRHPGGLATPARAASGPGQGGRAQYVDERRGRACRRRPVTPCDVRSERCATTSRGRADELLRSAAASLDAAKKAAALADQQASDRLARRVARARPRHAVRRPRGQDERRHRGRPTGASDVSPIRACRPASRARSTSRQPCTPGHPRGRARDRGAAGLVSTSRCGSRVAGRVKAGKSTLLNALVGHGLAAVDVGDCTRHVTWYVHGRSYEAMASVNGELRQVSLRRSRERDRRRSRWRSTTPSVDRVVVSGRLRCSTRCR